MNVHHHTNPGSPGLRQQVRNRKGASSWKRWLKLSGPRKEELRQDLKSLFQGAIRVTLEMVLEEELKAMVGARRFERVGSRKDHRNGTYLRRLLTSLGQIDVMVPRSREGGSPADVIGRYRRRSEEVDEMMVEAYVSGVSQRKMGDVTEALLGERVGRSTVRLVAKRLDGAVEALRSAPIEGPHPYLYLDATFLDARWGQEGRERERARGLRGGSGRSPPAPGHHARP